MTSNARPPRFARWLLRMQPLGERRSEIEADLFELFALRARDHGDSYARRRYYGDVVSLWRRASMWSAKSFSPPRPGQIVREVARDLTYAARLFRRSPGVVAVTIAGLGLAIGVSTAVFGILNNAVFRPSGIAEPANAVRVLRAQKDGHSTSWPYSEFLQLKDAGRQISLEAWLPEGQPLIPSADADAAPTASVSFVTGGFLEALTTRVAMGRLLTAADDQPGAAPVLVASHGFWTRRLGADPTVIGRRIRWNGVEFTVVGVTHRTFRGPTDLPPDYWAPLASYHVVLGGPPFDARTSTAMAVVGRIHPGASRAEVEGALGAIARGIATAVLREPPAGVTLTEATGPVPTSIVRRAQLMVAVVFTVIGLVVLLACVNVATLLLASAISRRREVGLRLALGASRARLARQLLTESLSLALIGGVVGLIITTWAVPMIATAARLPASLDLAPDIRVYAFLVAVSVIAGVGAGFAPARHALREDLASPLKGSADITATPMRLRSGLVGVQAAASIVLVVLAALLMRGMVRAGRVDVGFDVNRLLSVSPAFPRDAYNATRADAYWNLATETVRALPGVRSASLTSHLPFGGMSRVTVFRRAGSRYTIYHHDTRADYFATLGLRAVRGRTYTSEEVESRVQVAVISEALARDFFPGEDPIGQRLDRIVDDSPDIIIGIVSNTITARLRELGAAAIYRPLQSTSGAHMIIRADASPGVLTAAVRNGLQAIDPRVRLDIKPISERLRQQLFESRLLASLAGTLAGLALGLAIVGIYGVAAFVVGQRTQEIGVRIALGATGSDVMRLLLRDSLRPVMFGLAAGVIASLLGSRVLAGVLYGVSATDPLAFGAAFVVLLGAATAAVILPTRRAARVEPAVVLRLNNF